MKILILLLISVISSHSYALTNITEREKTEHFTKIWGLLKYRHPVVSKGRYDYNTEFINEIARLENISTREQFNEEMYNWVTKFNRGARYKTKHKDPSSGTITTSDIAFEWINSPVYSSLLTEELNKIKKNTSIGDHYVALSVTRYPNFKIDYALRGFDHTLKTHRLLLLASFWNAMNYWNVNVTYTDMRWEAVLRDFIPIFIETDKKLAFELAKEKLITSLNDSHGEYPSGYTMNNLMQNYPLFSGRIVNDSLVITHLRASPLLKDQDLNIGDVIFAADGKSLQDYYLDKFKNVISASNTGYIRRSIEKFFLFADVRDSIQVSVLKRNGITRKQYIKLYDIKTLPKFQVTPGQLDSWYPVKEGIGYIDLDKIKPGEIKQAFTEFKDYKAIILDLRNYTYLTESIADYLYPEEKQFVKLLLPYLPGNGIYNAKPKLRLFGNPFKAGRKNKDYYKGKVILLVDRATASHSEWIGMQIQQAPNCITIGEQTAGAVMNRNSVLLADNTIADYTYSAAFYPDDTPVQRQGLKINVPVEESARSYNPDIYIKEAIRIIEK